jgi:stringent starvation protein B
VQGGEIVLNISFDATSSLQLGNEFIEFKARFGGKPRDIMVPIHRVMAIYARENGQGMSFPVTDSPLNSTVLGMDKLNKVPHAPDATEASKTASPDSGDKPVPPTPTRPTLTRIK